MNKILLVYEDYADLMNVESTLKKVGFDVIGLTNEYTVPEQIIAFNPDLVVGSGRGGKVSSLGVGKRLKEMHRWQGRSVLIFPANFRPDPQELIRIRVDMMLEAPVPALRLVQVIGKLLNHDETVLLERLNKATSGETAAATATPAASAAGKFNVEAESIYIKGRTEEVDKNAEDRALRSEKINSEEGMNFSLNKEESQERAKISFKFGDRMSEAAKAPGSRESEDKASTLFADVDLKDLEKEILGGGTPEMERIEEQELEASFEPEPEPEPESSLDQKAVSLEDLVEGEVVRGGVPGQEDSVEVTGGTDDLQELQAKAQRELASAEKALKNRMQKYAEMVADVKVAPKSTVSRVEAKRRQKQLAADWDKENLNELDKLRREFTKALFKK